MSIKLGSVVAAFFGCLAVGSTFAWSNVPRPVPGQTLIAVSDATPRAPGAPSRPEAARPVIAPPTAAPARVAMIAAPPPESAPLPRGKADFDHAFAALSGMARPESTPAYREKLRQVGWKRLTASH